MEPLPKLGSRLGLDNVLRIFGMNSFARGEQLFYDSATLRGLRLMERQLLSHDAVRAAVTSFTGWRVEDGTLRCCYTFDSFVAAFGFMTQAALVSERMNHHPSWKNTYNRVDIELATHDLKGLSTFDVAWVKAVHPLALGSNHHKDSAC